MLASYQRCQRCRSRCRSVRTMSPGCRCWRIPHDSVICESRARTLSHLSSAALALHSLTWLLWWRFRLGSQLGLFSSIRQAGFPEIKCLEHILFLEILFSVGSDLLIADKNPARRLWLSLSRSLQYAVRWALHHHAGSRDRENTLFYTTHLHMDAKEQTAKNIPKKDLPAQCLSIKIYLQIPWTCVRPCTTYVLQRAVNN